MQRVPTRAKARFPYNPPISTGDEPAFEKRLLEALALIGAALAEQRTRRAGRRAVHAGWPAARDHRGPPRRHGRLVLFAPAPALVATPRRSRMAPAMQAIEFQVLCSGTRWLALAAWRGPVCDSVHGEADVAARMGEQAFGGALVAVARVPGAHHGTARWFAIGHGAPGSGSVTSSSQPAQARTDQGISTTGREPA